MNAQDRAGELAPLEAAVLGLLLAGEHPALVALRAQLAAAVVGETRFTGVGFSTTFAVPDTAPRIAVERVVIGDVRAEIAGLAHGAGFQLFVEDGRLTLLEGYAWGDEAWPERIERFDLRYDEPTRRAMLDDLVEGARSRFSYVCWFRDPRFPPDDQDHEWPACLVVVAVSAEAAQRWGDVLARRQGEQCGDEFLRSSIEPYDPSQPGVDQLTVVHDGDVVDDW